MSDRLEEREAERAANLTWLETEIAEAEQLGNTGRAEVYRRLVADVSRLAGDLDYVASCYHVAMHGIHKAASWRECDHQPCRSANGRFPSVRQVEGV